MSRKRSGRKVKDRAEAEELTAAWRSSGEKLSTWCESRGINWYSLSSYKAWGGRVSGSPAFVEVSAPVQSSRSLAGRYTLRIGAVVLELSDDFEEETVRRLVRVLAAC